MILSEDAVQVEVRSYLLLEKPLDISTKLEKTVQNRPGCFSPPGRSVRFSSIRRALPPGAFGEDEIHVAHLLDGLCHDIFGWKRSLRIRHTRTRSGER
jgi:hypothetical protein